MILLSDDHSDSSMALFSFLYCGAFSLLSVVRFIESNSLCDLFNQVLGVAIHKIVEKWFFHPLTLVLRPAPGFQQVLFYHDHFNHIPSWLVKALQYLDIVQVR